LNHQKIIAIDPGSERSALCMLTDGFAPHLDRMLYAENIDILRTLEEHVRGRTVVVEMIEGMGMSVGKEVFEAVYWIGRFVQAAEAHQAVAVVRVARKDVKLLLCGNTRAKDSNLRTALLDLYGPGKAKAIGLKHSPGPLYGVSGSDQWAALALGVAWLRGASRFYFNNQTGELS